jgi:cephalosporin hydroxylase
VTIPNDKEFESERLAAIKKMSSDKGLAEKSLEWMRLSDKYKYNYNFRWMGSPIIKYPNDIVVMQEIFWKTKPDLVIETGIARGGSVVFSASMQKMMDIEKSEVVGIDIYITPETKKSLANHAMSKKITIYEKSSVDIDINAILKPHLKNKKSVLVILDSDHTHEHVFKELVLYSRFVTKDSFLILPDTFIEYFPAGYYDDREWDVGNNPHTALVEFLKENSGFVIDEYFNSKALISEAINGFIRRIN